MAHSHLLMSRSLTTAAKPPPPPPSLSSSPISVSLFRKIRAASPNTSNNGDNNNNGSSSSSYLGMWKKAVKREREKKDKYHSTPETLENSESLISFTPETLEKKSTEFKKILQVPKEERDRVQRLQIIDRASAAISAARALLRDYPLPSPRPSALAPDSGSGSAVVGPPTVVTRKNNNNNTAGNDSGGFHIPISRTSASGLPGPDFWSWSPPQQNDLSHNHVTDLHKAPKMPGNANPSPSMMERERSADILSMPYESKLSENNPNHALPPFQTFMEVQRVETTESSVEPPTPKEEFSTQFSAHAAEAAHALLDVAEKPAHGVNYDGSRLWRETGTERRTDGVICHWTLNRGVTADGTVEWEEKFWEAADDFNYKELGSEKSGRDASGNVWHEYWKESMWQERGLAHIQKTADKWGKNGNGEEWQEKWWEHYDASGKADKWAHKWCSIDPYTQIETGHAHSWHERWGEKYDGLGGSIKYTDKWAERCEGETWVKWGDKWDEHFDLNGHGVKQGETWWEGKFGERWNRTWGEQHNGTGWIHKYGKSSNGDHWDTCVQEDTWYERYPHFGFMHCFENSVQLREVERPSEA